MDAKNSTLDDIIIKFIFATQKVTSTQWYGQNPKVVVMKMKDELQDVNDLVLQQHTSGSTY